HLKVLEGAGLVHRERRGREHYMALNAAPLREVSTWVHEYERFWTGRLDRLEKYFRNKRKQGKEKS
ncbi:MAG: helix-turn-helix transcriptional regulator, partial [Betaproteobacteria bacterium]|nr:helix-turn-helix transcriptional regulator [Betaproteobacteria bacterium]